MTIVHKAPHRGELFSSTIDSELPSPFRQLVDDALATALPSQKLGPAALGNAEALSWIGRSISVQEGILIEASIAEAARQGSRHLVLTGLKLPILQEALNLVSRHKPDQVCDLSVDADAKAVQSYFPDLVIVNRTDRSGIVIDVKRSLVGYGGGGKLAELQLKMAASALALPDILWRDHKRTSIDKIGTAIIDASRKHDDVDAGLWSLGGLDHLLGCSGTGRIAKLTIDAFREGVRQVWTAATAASSMEDAGSEQHHFVPEPTKKKRGRPPKIATKPTSVSLFRPGKYPVH